MRGLFITYFFPPVNVVASFRTASFAQHLPLHDIRLDILTRSWNGNETTFFEETSATETRFLNGCEIMSVDYHRSIWSSFKFKSGRMQQLSELLMAVADLPFDDDVFACFYQRALRLLNDRQYDFIMVSSGPLNLVKLACALNRATNTPYICDFRDLWSNSELKKSGTVGLLTKATNFVQRARLKRWLRNVSLVTTVNETLRLRIKKLLTEDRSQVVPNGYDQAILKESVSVHFSKFTICCAGTIYPKQDLAPFVAGFNLFLRNPEVDPGKTQLLCLGIKTFPQVEEQLLAELPQGIAVTTERKSHIETLGVLKGSHILFYPAWKGYTGITSAKVYEYLAVRKRILISPTDEDTIETLINQTSSGLCTDDPAEVHDYLLGAYKGWRANQLADLKMSDSISRFERKQIALDMALSIKNAIKRKPL